MQLLSIEVKNFKTFHSLKIDNLLGLSVIIGANGIGKSNVFSAAHSSEKFLFSFSFASNCFEPRAIICKFAVA